MGRSSNTCRPQNNSAVLPGLTLDPAVLRAAYRALYDALSRGRA